MNSTALSGIKKAIRMHTPLAANSPMMLEIGMSFNGFMKVMIPSTIKNTHVNIFLASAVSTAYNLPGGWSKINAPTPTIMHNIPKTKPNNEITLRKPVILKSQSSIPVNFFHDFLLFAS